MEKIEYLRQMMREDIKGWESKIYKDASIEWQEKDAVFIQIRMGYYRAMITEIERMLKLLGG